MRVSVSGSRSGGVRTQVAGRYEYTYRRAVDIDSYPVYGELHVYGGGGYVAELRGDRATIYDKVAELKAGGWIDKYTRAVFLEFAVYNPNVCVTAYARQSLSVAHRLSPRRLLIYC